MINSNTRNLSRREIKNLLPILKGGFLPNNLHRLKSAKIEGHILTVEYVISWVANDGIFYYHMSKRESMIQWKNIMRELNINSIIE